MLVSFSRLVSVAARGAVLLPVLLGVRCASARPAAPVPAAAVHPAEQLEPLAAEPGGPGPVEFRKFVLKLPRDKVIGAIQIGSPCVGRAPLLWKASAGSVDEGFGPLLLEELSAAGYQIVGGEEEIFEDPHGPRPEFVVAGVIRDVQANACFATHATRRATAEASLSIEWQIYSHRTKSVEKKQTTSGSSFVKQPQEDAAAEAITRAFVSAARNLLADSEVRALLSGRPAPPGPPADPIPIAYRTSPSIPVRSVESVVSDARMGVVTVLAGNALGSGFVISPDGYLLTGQHVVGQARYVKVKFVTGREVNGEVVRVDRRRDVALVKLENDIYPFLPIGTSSLVQPGTEVFAIGTPLFENLGQTVTKGIVSGYGEEDGLRVLRSDVSVHRGNSGGPLLDRDGIVVGLSVSGFMLMPDGVGVGLNSFIPIEEALSTLAIRRSSGK
jgi:S1-C subfamily serine protease